ncbi:hypothetical protein [Methylobacterium planeticum]|uniref:hypothetical protein n=1 Tax=Methylobacterium planeticum TaxID=2615211 RepID=UPI00177C91AF|nr:hypothetical protein [Methylobacterium planeticum]
MSSTLGSQITSQTVTLVRHSLCRSLCNAEYAMSGIRLRLLATTRGCATLA